MFYYAFYLVLDLPVFALNLLSEKQGLWKLMEFADDRVVSYTQFVLVFAHPCNI